jgi:AhpD family alkylhydroperoxidase
MDGEQRRCLGVSRACRQRDHFGRPLRQDHSAISIHASGDRDDARRLPMGPHSVDRLGAASVLASVGRCPIWNVSHDAPLTTDTSPTLARRWRWRMAHYHDPEDLKLLGEMKKLAPPEFKGFVELDAIVGREGGVIPRKYRELIALAVACTTQCPYCLDVHARGAKGAGATREEVAEVAFLSAALRAGAAVTHGALALKLFDGA